MGIFNNRAMFRIFLALILVAVVMFTAVYFVFNNSMNELYLQAVENNRLLVRDTIRSFDEYFKEINNIIYTLYVLPNGTYDRLPGTDTDLYDAYVLTQKLSQLISSKDYIEEVVLFHNGSPLAITSKGTINFNVLVNKKYKSVKYTSDYWMSFAKIRHSLKVMPVSHYIETAENSNILYDKKLICIIGNNQYFNSDLNILTFVYADVLFRSVKLLKGASLIAMDESRNIFIDSAGNNSLNDIGEIYFDRGLETVFESKGYEYYCVKSDYNGYTYIYKIPLDIGKFSAVLKTNQILLLVSIFLGIVLSIMLSFFLYKPVRKIIKLLDKDVNEKVKEDNYAHIYNSIENMRKENDSYHQQIDSSGYDIQRSIFFKMLDDVNYYNNLKEQINKYFKVIFNSRQFLMAAFLIEKTAGRMDSDDDVLSFEDIVIALQDALKKRFVSPMVFQTENRQYFSMIGQAENLKRDVILKNLESIVKELKNSSLPGYSIIAAVSREYTVPQDCKAAYRDIRMCFAYRNIKSSNIIIDIEKLDFSQEIYFPDDLTDKLLNCLSYGNTDECTRIVNQIIDKNVGNDISYIKFLDIIKIIFNRIIRFISVQSVKSDEIAGLEQAFYEKIENITNYEAIRSFLNETISKAAKRKDKSRQNRLNTEFVAQYINLHYFEDLYLDNIAEQFGTSPKYFSNYFKKAFGVNFVEYLSKIRISRAKEYLASTNLTIGEIREKVGYINSSTFTSTFRKYCGVSPNEYKAYCNKKAVR